jgi:hypothetical protein
MKGQEAVVEAEGKRLRVDLSALRVVEGAGTADRGTVDVTVRLQPRADSASSELNVIGCRVEEAVARVEKFLDGALLAELRTVRVIHGHGTGRLRNAIAEALKGHSLVARVSPAPAEHELPIHEYGHNGGNCSVTGGYLVRDRKLDSVYGRYLYADFCVGEIRSLVPRLSGARKDRSLGITKPGISTFGEGRGGKIFVASLFSGKVWQLKSK